jgi:hypothetical protein
VPQTSVPMPMLQAVRPKHRDAYQIPTQTAQTSHAVLARLAVRSEFTHSGYHRNMLFLFGCTDSFCTLPLPAPLSLPCIL